MGWKAFLIVILTLIIFIMSALFSGKVTEEQTQRTIEKKTNSAQSSIGEVKSVLPRNVASKSNSIQNPVDERIDPLANPLLTEQKERNRKQYESLKQVLNEPKDRLDLQFVGTDSWSFFSDLQVSKHSAHDTLFSFGPFHVSRRADNSQNQMTLVFNEKKKTLGVLTGRVVVKVRDHYDIDPITRDYDLKLDRFSPEIRTGYVSAIEFGRFANLNTKLKADHRVERFYFEIVNTDLVKN